MGELDTKQVISGIMPTFRAEIPNGIKEWRHHEHSLRMVIYFHVQACTHKE